MQWQTKAMMNTNSVKQLCFIMTISGTAAQVDSGVNEEAATGFW